MAAYHIPLVFLIQVVDLLLILLVLFKCFFKLYSLHKSGYMSLRHWLQISPWPLSSLTILEWNASGPHALILGITFEDIRRSDIIYYFSQFAGWQSQLGRSQSSLLIILFRWYIIRHLKWVKCPFCYAFHTLLGKACLPDDFGGIFYFSFFFSPELRVWKLGNSFYLYYLFVSNLLELFLFNTEQVPGGVSTNMFL